MEQLGETAAADDAVVDAGPETDDEQPMPVLGALVVEGDALLAEVEKMNDEEDAELDVAGTCPISRVEELRQKFDHNASRADEETADGEVAGVAQNEEPLQPEERDFVQEDAFGAEQLPTLPPAGGDIPVVVVPLSLAKGPGDDEQPGDLDEVEGVPGGGDEPLADGVLDTAESSAAAAQLPDEGKADMAPITAVDEVMKVGVLTSRRHCVVFSSHLLPTAHSIKVRRVLHHAVFWITVCRVYFCTP